MSLLDGAWDWLEGAARDAVDFFRGIGEWVVDGVLTLPLRFNVLMANYLPGVSIGGAEYFRPSHPDPDVAALLSGSRWKVTRLLPTRFQMPEATMPCSIPAHQDLSVCRRNRKLPSMRPWLRWLATSMSASLTMAATTRKSRLPALKPDQSSIRARAIIPACRVYGGETWLRIWILALCLERRVKLLSGSA